MILFLSNSSMPVAKFLKAFNINVSGVLPVLPLLRTPIVFFCFRIFPKLEKPHVPVGTCGGLRPKSDYLKMLSSAS